MIPAREARDRLLRLVVFVVEGQRYAVDLAAAERVLPMVAVSPLPGSPAAAIGVINLHGQVIPVLDIRRRFGLPPRTYGPSGRLLVTRTARRTLALPADEVQGVIEVAAAEVAPPETVLPGIGHVAGIVALPDGLLFIHNLEQFLSLEEDRQIAGAIEAMDR